MFPVSYWALNNDNNNKNIAQTQARHGERVSESKINAIAHSINNGKASFGRFFDSGNAN